MTEMNKEFKYKMVAALKALADEYGLSEIKCGDDELIARAKINCINGMCANPVLMVEEKHEMIAIRIRQVASIGTEKSVTNLTVATLFRDLASALFKKEELDRKDALLHVLAIEGFVRQQKNVWDLLAMIVCEMNNYHTETRSVVDYQDGEVFVDSALDCDFETVPDKFEKRLRTTIGHAQLLADILAIVREKISSEPVVVNEYQHEVGKVKRALAQHVVKNHTTGEPEPEEPENPDDNNGDEEITI